ncbi:hypothetical protein STEG23_015308 [Scotinomys teguina]
MSPLYGKLQVMSPLYGKLQVMSPLYGKLQVMSPLYGKLQVMSPLYGKLQVMSPLYGKLQVMSPLYGKLQVMSPLYGKLQVMSPLYGKLQVMSPLYSKLLVVWSSGLYPLQSPDVNKRISFSRTLWSASLTISTVCTECPIIPVTDKLPSSRKFTRTILQRKSITDAEFSDSHLLSVDQSLRGAWGQLLIGDNRGNTPGTEGYHLAHTPPSCLESARA